MELTEISKKVSQISDIYAQRFDIQRDRDWFPLKLQEEVGELAQAYLRLTSRARRGEDSPEEMKKQLSDEMADVLALLMLFAEKEGIDLNEAIKTKWFKYLA